MFFHIMHFVWAHFALICAMVLYGVFTTLMFVDAFYCFGCFDREPIDLHPWYRAQYFVTKESIHALLRKIGDEENRLERWKNPPMTLLYLRFFIVRKALVLIAVTFVSPILFLLEVCWSNFNEWRCERKSEREEAERDRRRQERERQEKEENTRRDEAAKAWLIAHQQTIFINTHGGITVALSQTAREECRKLTAYARADGKWDKENVLILSPETFVFVNKQGLEQIESVFSYARDSKEHALNWFSGWQSELLELARQYGAVLVKSEDLFVPWINGSLISHHDQCNVLANNKGKWKDPYRHLLMTEVPSEMRSTK